MQPSRKLITESLASICSLIEAPIQPHLISQKPGKPRPRHYRHFPLHTPGNRQNSPKPGFKPHPWSIVNPRKLEHGFRMISAGIPYTLPLGQEENDVPSFWLLLYYLITSPSS